MYSGRYCVPSGKGIHNNYGTDLRSRLLPCTVRIVTVADIPPSSLVTLLLKAQSYIDSSSRLKFMMVLMLIYMDKSFKRNYDCLFDQIFECCFKSSPGQYASDIES